jgi:hypothetical protein
MMKTIICSQPSDILLPIVSQVAWFVASSATLHYTVLPHGIGKATHSLIPFVRSEV